jgi:hypothetical protein
MPEEIEVDAEQLRGAIDRELEHGGGAFLRWISLSTAILAVLAAVGSLRAGATINEALLLKTEATQLQALASDQWSYYQAKGIKGAIAQGSVAVWQAAGKPVPGALAVQVTHYATEQHDIRKKAGELEHQRDEKGHEATLLVEQHHHYATAVALFQIAIALGAIAALTRVRLAWFASLLTGAIGVAALVLPWLRGP